MPASHCRHNKHRRRHAYCDHCQKPRRQCGCLRFAGFGSDDRERIGRFGSIRGRGALMLGAGVGGQVLNVLIGRLRRFRIRHRVELSFRRRKRRQRHRFCRGGGIDRRQRRGLLRRVRSRMLGKRRCLGKLELGERRGLQRRASL